MKSIPIQLGERSYDVVVGRGFLRNLGRVDPVASVLRRRSAFVVTDRTVWGLYGDVMDAGLRSAGARKVGQAILEPGEAHKNLMSAQALWDSMVEAGLERNGCVITLGGGVVGDLAGFAAATYHRGIDLVQAPTTLLAMVDASVGGKTGIDHPRGKNLIGAFHQPRAVAADLDALATLPGREILSGLAEVIKASLIGDPVLFDLLENRGPNIVQDVAALEEAVARAVALKARIVAEDERESGARALLNLGHTMGHALETAAGYGTFTHGEAVAFGMAFSARLARTRGFLSAAAAGRILGLLERWGYPLTVPEVPSEKILQALRYDKKSVEGTPRWVVLRDIGQAEWGVSVGLETVKTLLEELRRER